MYTLELNLKHSPLPIAVQKQELDAAQADYNRLIEALKSGSAVVLELTCDQIPGKSVTVLTSEVAAVQIYEKSGTASASGKPPGFFALMGGSAAE
ncbi:MAG: hypothetical protein O2890_02215 [Cyanobacteria bacterium]|nr:hypothetical protein [Cyanobacteriota bacterium]